MQLSDEMKTKLDNIGLGTNGFFNIEWDSTYIELDGFFTVEHLKTIIEAKETLQK